MQYQLQTWDSKFDLALLCFFFLPDPGTSTEIKIKQYNNAVNSIWNFMRCTGQAKFAFFVTTL